MTRRRIVSAALAALLLGLPGSSPGQVIPPAVVAPVDLNKSIYNVADYGAIAGDATGQSVDNAMDAIRAEIDRRDAALKAAGVQVRYQAAAFRFPASTKPWIVGRPHYIDHDRWDVIGDGRDVSKVASRFTWNHPAFIFGYPRAGRSDFTAFKGSITADYRPDAFGVLDATAAPAPGKRYGIKITPDVVAAFPNSGFSNGPGDGRRYNLLRKHTVEFCFVPADPTKPLPPGKLFGTGDWRIVSLGGGSNTLRVSFASTVDGVTTDKQVEFDCPLGPVTPVYRGTLQLDLDALKFQAWNNGGQLSVRTGPASAAWNTAKGGPPVSYLGNDLNPFDLGISSQRIDSRTYGEGTGPMAGTFFGVRFTDRAAYADQPGQPQTRLDGRPITDFSRYFDLNGGTFAALPLTDHGPDYQSIQSDNPCPPGYSNIHGYGLFTFYRTGANWFYTSCNTIRDLSVWTSGDQSVNGVAPFGQAVAVAGVREFTAKNLDLCGGAHGLGSLNVGPSWNVYLDDIRFQGTDAGLYGYWLGIRSRNLFQLGITRVGIRLLGSQGDFRGIFHGETCPLTEANIMLHGHGYGGVYNFDSVTCDTESSQSPTVAALVMEIHPGTPSRLRMTDFDLGQIPAGSAPILLRDSPRSNNNTPGIAIIDGLNTWSVKHRGSVVTQGPHWSAKIDHVIRSGNAAASKLSIPDVLGE